jgi:hypothetical protein
MASACSIPTEANSGSLVLAWIWTTGLLVTSDASSAAGEPSVGDAANGLAASTRPGATLAGIRLVQADAATISSPFTASIDNLENVMAILYNMPI